MDQEKIFHALVLDHVGSNACVKNMKISDLPEGDVLIKVSYSSLNYKDGLAVTGRGKIVRSYPMVPGIDLTGVVEYSNSPKFSTGDAVILTGWEIGEKYWGGYSQYARVKAEWLVPLPASMKPKHAMSIGTAGLTAMLSVMALEENGLQSDYEVVVTGAAGGVGSIAIALLSKLGYKVVASSGREEAHDYLRELGAYRIIDRQVLSREGKPLETQQWGGAIDTVGGKTLTGILRSLSHGGAVAACGLAGGSDFCTTVFPFILRGAKLIGIESVLCPSETRRKAWERLSQLLTSDLLERITQVYPLSEIPRLSEEILDGRVRGRIVIDVNALAASSK
ncbi:MDR family oxidoreductase [Paenactinomyces guangxiensis]|uniref:Oxidoreductase n=1 Tax=Paenactinomyces guangxiensis TaxID=1490290 RepID=A0A7W1WTZ5_9BACL|nr:MDR family oxidoreductase [Paenactinomyces guangxiensis]MBA4496043.1 oxidoreductase [Paenactinomyces guangxiensis]MBH8593131.1 oxidoreductase [Paenactinomyces guangxiensis]